MRARETGRCPPRVPIEGSVNAERRERPREKGARYRLHRLDQRWCFRDLAAIEKRVHCHSRDSITHLLNERPSIVVENRTECGMSPSFFKRTHMQERDFIP